MLFEGTEVARREFLVLLGFLALFALAYSQGPLYSSNQNTYFLHGLAAADPVLAEDWLARTADPIPLFSGLVYLTRTVLGEWAFYLWHVLLVAVYGFALVSIVERTEPRARAARPYYMPLLALIHAGLVIFLGGKLLGWNPGLLHAGLAAQYVLGDILQPSLFGVFLLLSIALFLGGRPLAAVAAAALAASFHSTYLLGAAALTLTYMLLLWRDRGIVSALGLGLVSLLLVLPVVGYVLLHFAPASPEQTAAARAFLVQERIPHHASPAHWFSSSSLFQLALVVAALVFYRRARVAWTLLVPGVVALALTLAQLFSDSQLLALLFPWRISVFLVPLATALLVGRLALLVQALAGRWTPLSRVAPAVSVAVLVGLAASGAYFSLKKHHWFEAKPEMPLARELARLRAPGQLYLIPSDLELLRMNAGVPVWADWKSHPYRDVEVLAWKDRVEAARRLYVLPTDAFCAALAAPDWQRVTHVVVPRRHGGEACPGFAMGPSAGDFAVQIRRR